MAAIAELKIKPSLLEKASTRISLQREFGSYLAQSIIRFVKVSREASEASFMKGTKMIKKCERAEHVLAERLHETRKTVCGDEKTNRAMLKVNELLNDTSIHL